MLRALCAEGRWDDAKFLLHEALTWENARTDVSLLTDVQLMGLEIGLYQPDADLAYECVLNLLHQQPHHVQVADWFNRVVIHMRLQKKAVRSMYRVLDRTPTSQPLRVLAGHCYLMTRQFELAAHEYMQAWRVAPHDPYLNLFLGTSTL